MMPILRRSPHSFFRPDEAAAFRAQPHAEAAVRLRRFDDDAKIAGLETPLVANFLPYVSLCMLPVRTA